MKFLIFIILVVAAIYFFNVEHFTVRHNREEINVTKIELDTGRLENAKDAAKKTISATKQLIKQNSVQLN